MPVAAEKVIWTLHLVWLVSFVGVTFLLLGLALANRLRVRRVLLAWRPGRFYGLPLWPSLFVGALLLFAGGALLTGHHAMLGPTAGYLAGGVFWFVAQWLAGSVLVTEFGLVFSRRRTQQAVAWGQIVDYFEAGACCVFFYQDTAGRRRRLDLPVPPARQAAFRKIVRDHLDARFDRATQQRYGKKAIR